MIFLNICYNISIKTINIGEYYKSNTEQQFDRATQLAEEIFDTDINKMMSVRDYIKNTYGRAFCARQIYGGDHFSHIIHNAWEAENVDELPTLTEKCIKRASNINLLWVKENSNMKDEVALYRELGTIFQYQVIPLEIFWAMEYRVKKTMRKVL